MTEKEFGILAKGMKAVYTYPSFLPDANALEIWYQLLKDLPYDVCNVAIQKYMMTETRIPTPADIRNFCTSVMAGDKPMWSDGWEEVVMAIRKHGSYAEAEALQEMSDITKQCVRRLGFQNLCRSEALEVDRANFRMIFEQIANREYEKAKMPAGMKQLIANMQNQKMLETKGD